MSLVVVVLFLIFSVSCCSKLSEARPQPEKLSPVVVVGTVYCDTCLQDGFPLPVFSMKGAIAAVECEEKSFIPNFYQEVETDEQGKFKLHLPFSSSKNTKEIQGCNVKLVKSNNPNCAMASTVINSSIHFKEIKQGKRVFSAGFFTFKPSKIDPEKCNKNLPKLYKNSLLFPNYPQFPKPNLPQLPPLPELPPLPQLPELPKLPSLDSIIPKVPSEKEKISKDQFSLIPPVISPPSTGLPLPPNPLQPSPLLPNPLQPPATGFLPPIPSLPLPPVPSLPLPPVPGLSPPSPPPTSSLPLPPLPPLIPGIPIPPSSASTKKETP